MTEETKTCENCKHCYIHITGECCWEEPLWELWCDFDEDNIGHGSWFNFSQEEWEQHVADPASDEELAAFVAPRCVKYEKTTEPIRLWGDVNGWL